MAPDAAACEEVERLNVEVERLNVEEYRTEPQGRRVLPREPAPAHAWLENEELDRADSADSPGESRRLLGSPSAPPAKSRLQAGLTLAVPDPPKRPSKQFQTNKYEQPREKTKFERRKEKLLEILKPPYFIVSMIMIIVCVHLWLPAGARARLEWAPGAWRREPWRLLTYGLVHASAAHLALNAVVALAVGWWLEKEQGWLRVLAVWWGGVAAGALGAGVLQPSVRVVGASAAVYALLTAHLPNVCLRFGHIPLWWFRPLSVLVLGASEGCWALVRAAPAAAAGAVQARAHASQPDDHVAWAAHALGAAVGVPLAFLVFTGENDSKPLVRVSRMVSLALLAGGLVAAALHYALWDDREPY